MIYKRFTEKAAEEWRQIYKVGTMLSSKCGADGSRLSNFSSSSSRTAPNELSTMRAPTSPS
jgi:hypothetical protein